MYRSERLVKVFAANVCLAAACLCGLLGLLFAFSPETFGALAAGRQMGVVAAVGALGFAAVTFTAGAFGALSLGWTRLVTGRR